MASKRFNLLDVTEISGSAVTAFDGVKKYVATGDVDTHRIVGETMVTYENRPSRANLTMKREEVLFAKMKATTKVLVGSPEIEDAIFSTGFYILKPTKQILRDYLYFYLLSEYFNRQKDMYSSGATMAGLGNAGLKRITISLPVDKNGNSDIKEQERMVALMREAEALKEKRALASRKTADVIPALFEKMFRGKSYPKEKLDQIITQKGAFRTGPFGSQLHHSEFTTEGIPVLGIDNVVSNTFRWTSPRCLPPEKYAKFKRYRVYPDDVLVTIMGTVGRACVAPLDLPECMSTKHLCVVTADKTRLNPVYLWASLLYDSEVRHQTRQVAKGAIMEGWNSTIIKNLKITYPPLAEQKAFADQVRKIWSLEDAQKKSAIQIEGLYSALLAKSFT